MKKLKHSKINANNLPAAYGAAGCRFEPCRLHFPNHNQVKHLRDICVSVFASIKNRRAAEAQQLAARAAAGEFLPISYGGTYKNSISCDVRPYSVQIGGRK